MDLSVSWNEESKMEGNNVDPEACKAVHGNEVSWDQDQ